MIAFSKKMDLSDDFWSAYELQMNGEHIPNVNRKCSSRSALFAVGGSEEGEHFSIERFCLKSKSWSIAQTSLTNRIDFAVTCLNNTHIYVIGGFQDGSAINEVVALIMFYVLFK